MCKTISCVLCCIAPLFCTDKLSAAGPDIESLITALNGQQIKARVQAAQVLGTLGPLARDAVPALAQALKADDLLLRHEAIVALGRIGDAVAVPAVIVVLDDPSMLMKHEAMRSLRLIGSEAKPAIAKLKSFLEHDDAYLRVGAARALIGIEPESEEFAKITIPLLIKALDHPREAIGSEAVRALAELGAPAVPSLAQLVGTSSPKCTWHICDVFAEIGPDAKSAVPQLLQALADKDGRVCWHAAKALGAVGGDASTVVPALVKLLRNDSVQVRAHSAYAIGQFPEAGKLAVSALAAALTDDNIHVRLAACRALGEIGPAAQAAIPALTKALDDESGSVTLSAAESLGRIGPKSIPVLVKLLQNPDMRPLSAQVLGEMGAEAKPAVVELVKYLHAGDIETRRGIITAIANIGPAATEAIPVFMDMLKDRASDTRPGAAYALAKIGAKQALPLLKKTVQDKNDQRLRLASAWALVQFDPQNDDYAKLAVPRLINALSDDWELVRFEAASALGLIGPGARSAVSQLAVTSKDDNPEVRAEALTALAKIGPDSRTAIPAIIQRLDDDASLVRNAACYALGSIGRDASVAIPVLKKKLKSRTEFERTVAAWALVKISPTAEFVRIAIPEMIRTLQHERPEVRVEAASVLGDIGRDDASVKEALSQAAKDPDESVRSAAKAAFNQLQN